MAHDLAHATAVKRNVDLIVVGEPNKKLVQSNQWIKDRNVDVALMFFNKNIPVAEVFCGNGYIRVDTKTCHIYCSYVSPNIKLEDFRDRIDAIMMDAGGRPGEKLIMGDFNAKSPLWGSPTGDKRGEYFSEWLSTLNLNVLNDGIRPTFIRGQTKSYIDVTCCTKGIQKDISAWEVLDDETGTEHQYISFEIGKITGKNKNKKSKPFCDWDAFKEIINIRTEKGISNPGRLESIVREAYLASSKTRIISRTPFWWDETIEDKRKECIRLRRVVTRNKGKSPRNPNPDQENYKRSKKELKALINKSKNKKWEDLCYELENDIWGKGYKIAMKKLVGYPPFELDVEQKVKAAKKLFPMKTKIRRRREEVTDEVELFTPEEYTEALQKMKLGRAPGPDGVPVEAIKKLEEIRPGMILTLINSKLQSQNFPNEWKKAKLILIPKGKAEEMNFRPICLLNSVNKLYESLLKKRLEKELEIKEAISDRQFGFRKGKSTIQAVQEVLNLVKKDVNSKWAALITLDVKNAFNSASWNKILQKLRKIGISKYLMNCMGSYLDQRSIKIDKNTEMDISAGVPQGSILGPTLWNVLYNDLLEIDLPKGCTIVAYADDAAVIVTAMDRTQLMDKANEALRQVEGWMKVNELELAPQKTEAVILKGRKNKEEVKFICSGVEILIKESLVYLGITMSQSCQFGPHIKKAVIEAEKKLGQIMRITSNLRGPGSKKRQMLYNVIQSGLTYGAPIWSDTAMKRIYKKKLTSIQRRTLLRVASAYRTVSARAIQVVTGTVPIELLIEERKNLYYRGKGGGNSVKREERQRTIVKWQEAWGQTCNEAQWTKLLVPRIDEWVSCNHRRTDYYLTQALTGHGSFKTYTKRIGKTDDDICRYCNTIDTPAHTLFECMRWSNERGQINMTIGRTLSAENMVALMIADRSTWNTVHEFVKQVMQAKERDERQRQVNRQ